MWQCGGGEGLGLLADEESGFAGGLDGGLFDGGDGDVEVVGGGGGDGDEAGVAEDAVACGELGFLLEDVVVFGGLAGVFDLPDLLALGGVGDVFGFFLRMSRAAWSERMGVHSREKDRWMPESGRVRSKTWNMHIQQRDAPGLDSV